MASLLRSLGCPAIRQHWLLHAPKSHFADASCREAEQAYPQDRFDFFAITAASCRQLPVWQPLSEGGILAGIADFPRDQRRRSEERCDATVICRRDYAGIGECRSRAQTEESGSLSLHPVLSQPTEESGSLSLYPILSQQTEESGSLSLHPVRSQETEESGSLSLFPVLSQQTEKSNILSLHPVLSQQTEESNIFPRSSPPFQFIIAHGGK
uniref:Uncharacterized protein n=1 Tax=Chromera velia CCMP2878 TaxID=1169474 RepID=A0A0G4GH24_9ALVE|eukprot:Cvel_4684.t1-p1 / transcript=Cvel_4684.t1 / gene=Cvel_4684 / organism=Chromera_velia_CCMP2878 / gene_product=hypothetical protein / transcript_product=hypothetical protein / location=Cvel_scaffold207:66240-69690(+) / protein_length=210 / sequence_SO=supercontig / SO=protein_coding / is_pseudo=false